MTSLRHALAAMVVGMGSAAAPCLAGLQSIDVFTLDGHSSNFTKTTCVAEPMISGFGSASAWWYAGRHTYRFEVLRNNSVISAAENDYTAYQYEDTTLTFLFTVAAASGTYRLRAYVDGEPWSGVLSSAIAFTLEQTIGSPVAKPLINGDASAEVAVCPGGPITLDGSPSECASGYFVGIEFSDQNWTRLGGGGGAWINGNERERYGQISSFDLKKFAEDRYIGFYGGQHYLVKLAVGTPWNESTRLISITPPVATALINDDPNRAVAVCTWGPMILDGSPSVCASDYFVGIELSDQSGAGLGGGGGGRIGNTEVRLYGPINAFNLRPFAAHRFIAFVPGQYYLVKLAVASRGPIGNWSETTKLMAITGSRSAFTINGRAGGTGAVLYALSTQPIRLNGLASTCARDFFLSVQQTDADGHSTGPAAARWLTREDFANYGRLDSFDVKAFAQSFGAQLFPFSTGEHYRVKWAVGPEPHETELSIAIGDPCDCFVPGCQMPDICNPVIVF